MNELSKIFIDIRDGETVVLEKGRVYDVRQDDSFELTGYYCSNTAKKHENPDGMRKTAVFLKEKKNITIDGNGATLLVHGKMTPMLFDRCENVTVRNLTVDYACPTMAEYEILSNENGVCVIRINPECRFRVSGNEIIWMGEDGADGKPYWEDSHVGNRRHVKLFDFKKEICRDFRRDDLHFEKIEQLDSVTLRVHLRNKTAPFYAGCVVQTRNIVRDQTGSIFQRCKNLTFEGLRIKFMHGLGMVSQFCENVSFIGCDLTPAEGRSIASTADFFQFSGCRGKLTVADCKAWGAQDDYINVHGTHLRIVKKDEEKRSITVRFMHDETWGLQAFETGDELEFIKWDTLIPYAKATVTAWERIDDTDILLTLDSVPDAEIGKDVVENASWTPDLHVCGCDFGPTAGRGILCTTRGKVVIENNRFRNLWGPALLIEDDCNFWFESGYTTDITFRNNTVDGCEYGGTFPDSPVIRYTPKVMNAESAEFVHGKLTLTGNTFINPRAEKHGIHLEYLREAVIEGNSFDAPFEITQIRVGDIKENNNTVINKEK